MLLWGNPRATPSTRTSQGFLWWRGPPLNSNLSSGKGIRKMLPLQAEISCTALSSIVSREHPHTPLLSITLPSTIPFIVQNRNASTKERRKQRTPPTIPQETEGSPHKHKRQERIRAPTMEVYSVIVSPINTSLKLEAPFKSLQGQPVESIQDTSTSRSTGNRN
jgi:hypothetical protein